MAIGVADNAPLLAAAVQRCTPPLTRTMATPRNRFRPTPCTVAQPHPPQGLVARMMHAHANVVRLAGVRLSHMARPRLQPALVSQSGTGPHAGMPGTARLSQADRPGAGATLRATLGGARAGPGR